MNESAFGSPEALRNALEDAHLPTLLLAMATLSGDEAWLRPEYRPCPARGMDENDSAGLPDEVQAASRAEAFDLICAWRAGQVAEAAPPAPDQLVELLEVSLGSSEEIPRRLAPLFAEEFGSVSRDVVVPPPPEGFRVLVIGSGFGGVCAGIKLKQAGIDFSIIEKNETVGGTWWENSYPGAGVDSPCHLYSYSFDQRPDWSRYYAKRDEIQAYIESVTDRYGIREFIRFGHEVISTGWDESTHCWNVTIRRPDGAEDRVPANVVITGTGYLNKPIYPDIDGLDSFAGPAMHTARWRSDVQIEGQRVAVLGTGASAMQLVPAIAGTAERVLIFQRSPQWGVPNFNYLRDVADSTKLLMQEVPHYLQWYRLRQLWLMGDRLYPAMQVDPEWPHPERAVNEINDRHRKFLTKYIISELGDREDLIPYCVPTYPPYGKRPLLDAGWFRAVRRDDVELITDRVMKVTPQGIVTESGEEHQADVLVIATGFDNRNLTTPIEIRGRSGRTLRETWGEESASSLYGLCMPDFPNLFFLLGPNTIAGHGGSGVLSVELGVRYAMKMIARMIEGGFTAAECTQVAHDEFSRELDAVLDRSIWAHQGFTTYYRSRNGRIVTPMPWTNADYWHMTCEPAEADFDLRRVGPTGG